MTSEPTSAYVWVWLPDAVDPVVAGELVEEGGRIDFQYARTYLGRPGAIPLYLPDLPLRRGLITPSVGTVAGCIEDAAPDSWGRRVILYRRGTADRDVGEAGLLGYLLESGSDRIGALDFQTSATTYAARSADAASLDDLVDAAAHLEAGLPLPPALDAALLHGSSIGGARPKALLAGDGPGWIAKFSSASDYYPVVQAEFVAMELARRSGLTVPAVEHRTVLGRHVLLVERFDRTARGGRRLMVSALTVLGLDLLGARYGSYADLAHVVRARFADAEASLHELFGRITFNVLCSNTDDHPRNHAAFWDGSSLALTPAYDICPQPRAGGEAAQIMAIGEDGYRMSQATGCVDHAATYHLSAPQAQAIVDRQIDTITRDWDEVCDLAELTLAERRALRDRQFLNPYALEGYAHPGWSLGDGDDRSGGPPSAAEVMVAGADGAEARASGGRDTASG